VRPDDKKQQTTIHRKLLRFESEPCWCDSYSGYREKLRLLRGELKNRGTRPLQVPIQRQGTCSSKSQQRVRSAIQEACAIWKRLSDGDDDGVSKENAGALLAAWYMLELVQQSESEPQLQTLLLGLKMVEDNHGYYMGGGRGRLLDSQHLFQRVLETLEISDETSCRFVSGPSLKLSCKSDDEDLVIDACDRRRLYVVFAGDDVNLIVLRSDLGEMCAHECKLQMMEIAVTLTVHKGTKNVEENLWKEAKHFRICLAASGHDPLVVTFTRQQIDELKNPTEGLWDLAAKAIERLLEKEDAELENFATNQPERFKEWVSSELTKGYAESAWLYCGDVIDKFLENLVKGRRHAVRKWRDDIVRNS